jgi:hypothetical protein
MITVTTGKSEDDVGLVGQDLRKQKIVSIVVSVGENVDKPQGIQLATTPEHSFAPDDVAKLPPVVQDVVERINKGIVFFVVLVWVLVLCCSKNSESLWSKTLPRSVAYKYE